MNGEVLYGLYRKAMLAQFPEHTFATWRDLSPKIQAVWNDTARSCTTHIKGV